MVESNTTPISLGPDVPLLLLTRALRLFAGGLVSVILAIYLASIGLELPIIGAIFMAAFLGNAGFTVLTSAIGDRVGRRRFLVSISVLMAVSGVVFALTDAAWVLMLAAFLGVLNPNAGEVGSTVAIEQAALAEAVLPSRRTAVFAWSSLVASAATALGALAAGVPVITQRLGFSAVESYRLVLWAYAALGLVLALLCTRLSQNVEAPRTEGRRWVGLHRSRGLITRFALLTGLNTLGAGFVVQSFVAYWFVVRFAADAATLGLIFFLTNLVGALSYLVAVRIAARIGLINTMVFTHFPSNLLLMLVPLMPTLPLAAAVLVMRHALSQMDRPARESYTMAVVAPDERTAAAGAVALAANASAALAVSLAGVVAQVLAPGLLFIIAGVLRCVYNLALFLTFRHIKPPEDARGE